MARLRYPATHGGRKRLLAAMDGDTELPFGASQASRPSVATACAEAMAHRMRVAYPELLVRVAYLQFCQPDLPTSARALVSLGCMRIYLLPLFMLPGRHTDHDIPALVNVLRAELPDIDLHLALPLAVDESFLNWLTERVGSLLEEKGQ